MGGRYVHKNIPLYSLLTLFFLLISCTGGPSQRDPVGTVVHHDRLDLTRPDERGERPEETGLPWKRPRDFDLEEMNLPLTAYPEVMERKKIDRAVERIIAAMSPAERIGQLFMPALVLNKDYDESSRLTPVMRKLIEQVKPGGIILFGPNLSTPEGTRTLIEDIQAVNEVPLLIAIDQEGGMVDRLGSSETLGATAMPSAGRVGMTGDAELAYRLAKMSGEELRYLGINMNLAPVADVATNPENTVIGSRAYGSTPQDVSTMVDATVRGYRDAGIIPVLKHFPGHGDTIRDTHYSSAVVPHDLDRLESVELIPFRTGIDAGADAILVGHMSLPEIQGNDLPATFSPEILKGLLRDELGFNGVVITDALIMGALMNFYPQEELALRAFTAGADILLRSPEPLRDLETIIEAYERGDISDDRVIESVARILRLKFQYGLMEVPPPSFDGEILFSVPEWKSTETGTFGSEEHRALVEEIYRRSS